ncbi:MAG: glycosyltransferase family 2 protein [Patescibacteria group bacterium]|nr:glycosyltransferase family 2 protein [Patescibacteria group bacterium]
MVSVIIPAHNEEKTIGQVIKSVRSHPSVEEILVVNDGSTDETVAIAKRAGATIVYSFPVNQGKAAAMHYGVNHAKNNLILFLDADIEGLTHETVTELIEAVSNGGFGMAVVLRGRGIYWSNKILRIFPAIGGERVLTKELWGRVPHNLIKGFQIEIALNYYAKSTGARMKLIFAPTLHQTIKERKYGLWNGLLRRARMIEEMCVIGIQLYFLDSLHIRAYNPAQEETDTRV